MINIKRPIGVACAALLLALPLVGSAKDDYGCEDVNFAEEITNQLPKVRDACQDVTIKNDKVYAHFLGEVTAIDAESVTVRFKSREGKDISELRIAPSPEVMVKADGKSTPFSKLEKGMKIDAYIDHTRWGLYAEPDGKYLTILDRKEL